MESQPVQTLPAEALARTALAKATLVPHSLALAQDLVMETNMESGTTLGVMDLTSDGTHKDPLTALLMKLTSLTTSTTVSKNKPLMVPCVDEVAVVNWLKRKL